MRNATNERPGQSGPQGHSAARGAWSGCVSRPGALGQLKPSLVQEVSSTETTGAEIKKPDPVTPLI